MNIVDSFLYYVLSSDFCVRIASANLNKLDDVSLRVVKERMEASFDAHRLKPGDPNFEYDIQVCTRSCFKS